MIVISVIKYAQLQSSLSTAENFSLFPKKMRHLIKRLGNYLKHMA